MAAMNQAKSMTSLLLKPAGKQLLLLIDKKSRMKSWIVQTLLKVFIHSTTYQRRQVRRNQIVLKTTDGSLVHVKKYNCTSPKLASPASCKVRVALGFWGEQSENPWPTSMGGLSLRRGLLENLGTRLFWSGTPVPIKWYSPTVASTDSKDETAEHHGFRQWSIAHPVRGQERQPTKSLKSPQQNAKRTHTNPWNVKLEFEAYDSNCPSGYWLGKALFASSWSRVRQFHRQTIRAHWGWHCHSFQPCTQIHHQDINAWSCDEDMCHAVIHLLPGKIPGL